MAIKVYPEVPLLQKDLIDDGSGYYPTKFAFDVLGTSPAVNNARVDVTNIGGATSVAYVFPPAGGIQMQVVSTSANDTAAGTGVRTLLIHYLDANYAVQSESVTMNGTTPVNTVATNILRVQEMHVFTLGSGVAAAGTITLKNTAATVTYASIDIAFNRSRNAVYTIPAGKTGYLTHWDAFSGTATGTHFTTFTLRLSTHDGVLLSGVFLAHDGIGTLNGGNSVYYDIPITCPEKTDIKVSVISDSGSASAQCTSHFSGWYE